MTEVKSAGEVCTMPAEFVSNSGICDRSIINVVKKMLTTRLVQNGQ